MASYFHGSSEIQAATPSDGIQTLYLMNPNYLSSYSDTTHQQQQQQPQNMLFFNPMVAPSNGLNPTNFVSSPNHQQLVGIPLPGPTSNITSSNQDNQTRSASLHGVVPGVHYNIWGPLDQNSVSSVAAVSDSAHDWGFRRPLEVSPARQGLSLSLSSQQAQAATPTPPLRPINNEVHEIQAMHGHFLGRSSGEDVRVFGNSPSSASAVSNGVSGMQKIVMGSKYLRAAQELLDEVVNVGNAIKSDSKEGTNKEKIKLNKESSTGDESSGGGGDGESRSKPVTELTTTQKQELQMKKAKLVNVLEEVEQRYRQYHQQMQMVVLSFEQAAGIGAAKSYTALALQTISKQFRCLKDTISGQIKATNKSLGEEDCLGVKVEGLSRLRYVDHQLRQQRALQQLGMIQHNAWRPQRGLPERAVSVLRAWLFEHFLHPYPKDSDKQMLAKQTGLTRSQVSNWFINARVRLWKPMVEEMYLEEVKDHEKNGSPDDTNKKENSQDNAGSSSGASGESRTLAHQSKSEKPFNHNASTTEFSTSTISMSNIGVSTQLQGGFTLMRPSEMEGIAQSPKRPRSTSDMQNSQSGIMSMDMDMDIKQGEMRREKSINFGGERLTKEVYPLFTTATNHSGGFGAYPIADLGRFNPEQMAPRYSGNGVSLTLGLQHCENLSISGTQQNFLSNQNIQLGRRLEMGAGEPDFCGINTTQSSHSSPGFENIDIQNRKRFAAQLLPDFVA